MLATIEHYAFKYRVWILVVLGLFTVWMGYHAYQLKLDPGFEKQMPTEHPYIETLLEYRDQLPPPNRIQIVVSAKDGDVWDPEFLHKLEQICDDVFYLPGVNRGLVRCLWTPNNFVRQVTEVGLEQQRLIGAHTMSDSLTQEQVDEIRGKVVRGGHMGSLIALDNSAAMIEATLLEIHPQTRERLDYIDLAHRLESEIRQKHENEDVSIHIIGFAKLIGDVADRATDVVTFFGIAFLLTLGAVYIYAKSIVMAFLAVFSSLVSVIWQFGLLKVLGYGLDPLAILVPFLVYAIGVSHAIQQINLITAEISRGASSENAARATFRRLLLPGSMALITDLAGFLVLVIIPIPMIGEMAITASIGVALKIITNLLMLPLIAAYFTFPPSYVEKVREAREFRIRWLVRIGKVANTRNALISALIWIALGGYAGYVTQDRVVGDLHAGAPELWPDERYNVDARMISGKFDVNLDILIVVTETPSQACVTYEYMEYIDQLGWHIQNIPGVNNVVSLPRLARFFLSVWNEANLKFAELNRNRSALVLGTQAVPESSGLLNTECTMLPVYVFTEDHKADTINRIVEGVKDFRANNPHPDVNIRLASGNVGILAATNEVIEETELPSLMFVFAVIITVVMIAYRDWRAAACCCLPLLLATVMGYWFMQIFEIGLKISTLPVLVLAVGFGVDDGFYMYSRIQVYLREGYNIAQSFQQALLETGMAVIFTSVVLAIGVATWIFSALKFQADMGALLTFMISINLLGAITALPALAVLIDLLIPRRKAPPEIAAGTH